MNAKYCWSIHWAHFYPTCKCWRWSPAWIQEWSRIITSEAEKRQMTFSVEITKEKPEDLKSFQHMLDHNRNQCWSIQPSCLDINRWWIIENFLETSFRKACLMFEYQEMDRMTDGSGNCKRGNERIESASLLQINHTTGRMDERPEGSTDKRSGNTVAMLQ